MEAVLSGYGLVSGLLMLVFVAGVAVSSRAESLLRNCLAEERWEPGEMERLKKTLAMPIWTVLFWSMAAFMLAGPLFSPRPSLFVFLLVPFHLIGRLRQVGRPKMEPGLGGVLSGVKSIRSEHWGER